MWVCLAALAAGAACGWPGTTSVGNAPASSARTATKSTPAAHGAVWVVATVPVQLHSAADMNSARVDLLSWGQHLTVTGSQKVGADTFLEVKTDGGTQGWVVDRPDLVIHRSVSKKIVQTFQILYPSEWNVSGDNPVIFASPSSDPEGINMLVQTAA
ncbi:MAG: SH3 domain-containing protein, partial [Candidatus Dormibacteraeota bacterium]|nr:SH3 domain-containing protein [Candidatus Dormibacteraeota bacterium]